MQERAKLRDLFPDAPAGGELLWQSVIVSIDQGETEDSVELEVACGRIIPEEELQLVRDGICKAYGLRDISIHIRYELTEAGREAEEYLRRFFALRYPSISALINSASLSLDRALFCIELDEPWKLVRVEQLGENMARDIRDELGLHVRVEARLESGAHSAESYEEMRAKELKKIREEIKNSAKAAPAPAKLPQQRTYVRKKDPAAKKFTASADQPVLFGKPVTREISRIGDVTMDSGKVCVEGEVFFKDIRKFNTATKVSFDITDGTGSIRVVKMLDEQEAKDLHGALKPGLRISVQGVANYSKYDKDINLNPSAIVKLAPLKKTDMAKQKRVELHFHTVMSAMDAICDVGKAFQMASDMGHRALAITDHGVAQAFPDAMKASENTKKTDSPVKAIYGIEAYCVNDLNDAGAVKGGTEAALDDEIVVFDLETTGLRADNCEIIEIAAVKLRGLAQVEKYHSFVKPKSFIPAKITELTGITQGDVADARPIEDVLPEFLSFCGGAPLCAHNADFDISFLRAACRRQGAERSFCSIDTVALARALMPELPNHKLNTIAAAMGFKFRHHRADDDAEVLAKIFVELIGRLRDRSGIKYVSEINGAAAELKSGGSISGRKSWHLIILVKNRAGLLALYKMISDAHLKYFRRHPIIPMSQLRDNRENLILGSACEAGELFTAVVEKKPQEELERIASFFDFLEIQPLGNNRFMLEKGLAKDDGELMDFNRKIVALGEKLGKPVCATGDVHFLYPEDAIYREILMTGMGFADADRQAPLYFRSTDEMLHEFEYLGAEKAFETVVTNTNLIADMCEEIEPVLKGTYPPSIENSARDLEEMVYRKVDELYSHEGKMPEIVSKRLEAELVPIIKHGYDVMYMTAQKLVEKSNQAGYIVGSRGSVGSSLVAFLAGITEVNGLPPHYRCPHCRYSVFDESGKYQTGVDMPDELCPKCGTKMVKDGFNIPFATFLGFDADKAPDIDLNFSGEYQLTAHRETIKLFGEGNVFKAGTIGTVKDRTAYGFVKKYLEEKGRIVSNAEENRLVQGCTGVKRTTGQHPGGLIVVPKDRTIYEFCPVQRPADDVQSDIITTHFDYHSIHDNLLKLDLLGHDGPTIIRRLYDLSGIDPLTVPLDDRETMRIFTDIGGLKDVDGKGIETDDILEQTGAAAIPEFGTKFVRGMLVDTQPDTFDGLVRISGLSHGTDVWMNNAQDIVRNRVATLKDVISVRDDITVYLIQMGVEPKQAFTISESVRKGKGLKPEWEELMLEHKVPQWYIESCNKIKYMFPRAHAVAYVMTSFRIAWFKVHRPLEFYSAFFSISANGFDAALMTAGDDAVCRKYRELKAIPRRSATEDDMMITLEICHEFYKRGFSFTGIDLYRSEVSAFKIDGNTLIPPFTAIPGLGEAAAQSIVEEREKGAFMSAEDITLRCDKVSKAIAEKLGEAGALRELPKSNQLDLFEMLTL